ncbi:MAG: hypothetical protein WB785_00840 [Mycobacterium sp.]|uniref:hypothetical protein n=1 Tax=Mycobacterium sp. TaxID=1785 RepID=UPI003C66AC5E
MTVSVNAAASFYQLRDRAEADDGRRAGVIIGLFWHIGARAKFAGDFHLTASPLKRKFTVG